MRGIVPIIGGVLLLAASDAWADKITPGKFGTWPDCPCFDSRAQSIEARSKPYYQIELTTHNWRVSRGTESYTLSEFVSGGKFCEIYGHRWTTDYKYWDWNCTYGGDAISKAPKCPTCDRCRRKIQKTKSVEEWED